MSLYSGDAPEFFSEAGNWGDISTADEMFSVERGLTDDDIHALRNDLIYLHNTLADEPFDSLLKKKSSAVIDIGRDDSGGGHFCQWVELFGDEVTLNEVRGNKQGESTSLQMETVKITGWQPKLTDAKYLKGEMLIDGEAEVLACDIPLGELSLSRSRFLEFHMLTLFHLKNPQTKDIDANSELQASEQKGSIRRLAARCFKALGINDRIQ